MPTNKNAIIRYRYLDELLSDSHHYYNVNDLVDKVNENLRNNEYKEVGRRCIEKDLIDLEGLFGAPIERYKENGKNCVKYAERSFSIFIKEMSNEERRLLCEVLNTIGQFEGLDNFRWLDDFKAGFEPEERRQIICFSNNPYLKNSNLLGTLFDNISNKVVVQLSYHTFSDETVRTIDIHPFLLKQYNDRWFLLGAADSDEHILTIALDRIDEVKPLPERKYAECPEDLTERFEDIVGVTLFEDRPVEHVLFWVSNASKGYVATKPIHGSQTQLKGEKEQQLREQYPQLEGGAFFTIDCIRNYELIRELTSFGKDLIVLSEGEVKNDILKRIQEMNDMYLSIL
ncbi:MAG: WYL domain-containing protein [Bacteroidaceae bacterium]|nr:WYL domain-containing protein [Bacteroidaceae bacterium]